MTSISSKKARMSKLRVKATFIVFSASEGLIHLEILYAGQTVKENKELKKKLELQQEKIDALEKGNKRKNIIIFGIEEAEKYYINLEQIVLNLFNQRMELNISLSDLDFIKRLGDKTGRVRPIIVGLISWRKKLEILSNKKKLRNTKLYIEEDYSITVLETRRGLRQKMKELREDGQLISIRSQSALYGTTKNRQLKVWAECDDVQDYVTVYDGYTTRDPVILKFCGGGEAVPEAVSSGHELLVEFTTSPYGTFLHPTPIQSLHGFQLEVEVKFVNKESPTYVRNKRNCEFWLRGTNRGILESPLHSLTPNTTCLYHLQRAPITVSKGPVIS
ncbi:uncharacterized protein CBL_20010 [Carabus blaptoides fortunei]